MNKSPLLLRQINKIRGAYASRPHVKDVDTVKHIRNQRLNITRCLLAARVELPVAEFEAYLEWHQNYDRLLNIYKNSAKGFDYLNSMLDIKAISLDKEIAWISFRIKNEASAINKFRSLATSMDIAVLKEEWVLAKEYLNQKVDCFGESMWSVQLRMAIEQACGGLEAQKKYYEVVKSQFKNSLLSLVGYNTSIRNEERTSLRRFKAFLCPKLKKNYEASLVSYLNYRLFSEWGATDREIADVLRIEQSHSIIDIYETFLSLSQEIFRRADLSHLRPQVCSALKFITEIDDFRIVRLLAAAGDVTLLNNLPIRDTHLGDAAIQNRPFSVARAIKKKIKHPDPWYILYQGLSLAHLSVNKERRKATLPLLIANVLSRGENCERDLQELEKRTLNLSMLPSMRGVYDFVDTIRPSLNTPPFRFYMIGINSMCLGAEEVGLNESADKLLLSLFANKSPSEQFWTSQTYDSGSPDVTSSTAKAFADALRIMRMGELVDCISRIGDHYKKRTLGSKLQVIRNDSEPLREMCLSLLIYAHAGLGAHGNLIELIAENVAENPSSRTLLPIETALKPVNDNEYKSLQEPLAGLIALHSLWLKTEDTKILSSLRFSTDRFLRAAGAMPSQLIEQAKNYPLKRLIYFLRYVCTPNIIDTSRLFNSSREVLEERQEICGVLNILDPERQEEYQNELISIAHHLKVSEGMRIVNRNRVHVDTDALKRWVIRTLSEDFSRYQDLAKLSGQLIKNYDETLNEILSSKDKSMPFVVPESEADLLLLEIIEKIREEFLNNSSYGLDYFLSHRVRHQSFISLIRSPLETHDIITTRATEHSGYKPNEKWLLKFANLSAEERAAASSSFNSFAQSFDRYMSSIKDDLFQIRSQAHPKGLFYVYITQSMFLIARSVSKEEYDLEALLYVLIPIFWASLESGLEAARDLISDTIKMKIDADISTLREEVRSVAEHDPAFAEFSYALTRTSSSIQDALTEAQAWFLAPEVRQARHRFTLNEGLEIAVESVLKLHRSFEPQLQLETIGDVELVGSSLMFITDVILVGFSNIKAYSRNDKPRVKVKLESDNIKGTLSVEIINESSSKARSLKQDAKLAEIRKTIEQRSYGERARNEGETGFLKLATLVHQSSKGAIEFGYLEDNQFRLFVTFSLIVEQATQEKAA